MPSREGELIAGPSLGSVNGSLYKLRIQAEKNYLPESIAEMVFPEVPGAVRHQGG
jgi:hypothetical protein